jgi:hypothetical protein
LWVASGGAGWEELENLSFFFFPSFFFQQLNPTFVVLETKVVKQNPTLQEGGEERERDWGKKQNQQQSKRESESFGGGGKGQGHEGP